VGGISFLFALCKLLVEPDPVQVPVLLVGYGFGASFVAMFAQLGGGIYTKAADVGADLCGKIELEILGGKLTSDCALSERAQMHFLLFPLVVHVVDLVVSTMVVMAVRPKLRSRDDQQLEDPMSVLKVGFVVAIILASGCFVASTRMFLHVEEHPDAWWHFCLCGIVGMVSGFIVVLITQYYTDFTYGPVRNIAKASESGHGTNIIAGLGVGFESTMLPILVVVTAILTSYFLGQSSGLKTIHGQSSNSTEAAGLFGTAVATMGMLSNLTYVLAMDVFGPITDNAAGIVEMSPDCPPDARDFMDRLDAAGNTTKAFTKGFAVGSAGLAVFLLFSAFLDVVYKVSCKEVKIDIVQPEVFSAGIVSSSTVFLFAAFAMQAVGDTAAQVVTEVRRQFRDVPGIATGQCPPQYGRCVEIVSKEAIKRMVKPGLLVVLMPILVGLGFRLVGLSMDNKYLGAEAMTSYLVCSSMTAMLVALFLNNGGGAWDNAKKYIESGQHGGKGSDAHKAAVTGDTVGDPCKDTAGPSLHVLMKLTATVTMVIGPLVAVPFDPCPKS